VASARDLSTDSGQDLGRSPRRRELAGEVALFSKKYRSPLILDKRGVRNSIAAIQTQSCGKSAFAGLERVQGPL
jgi:hypothetical protein